MASGVVNRKPRILILHGMRAEVAKKSYATPILDWFEDLGRRGIIEPLMIGVRPDSTTMHPPLDAARRGNVDGIVSVALFSEEYLSDLAACNIPLVILDHEPLMKLADSVAFDNVGAAAQLGREIVERGHRNILYVSRYVRDPRPVAHADPRIEAIASQERRGGLMTACEGSSAAIWGMLPWHSFGALTSSTGSDALTDARIRLKRMLDQAGRPPDCIVAVDYAVAEDMYSLIQEFGWRVPENVSLATFQLHPYVAEHPLWLKISHMSMDYGLMAEEGWRLLSARMKKGGSAAPIQNSRISAIWLDFGSVVDRRGQQ